MTGFLNGIRAVGIAWHGVGPIAGFILAQFGAEVIKIENRIGGDPTRGYNRPGVKTVPPGGHTIMFEAINRQTKSLTIDLSNKNGREIAYRLITRSDALFTNYLALYMAFLLMLPIIHAIVLLEEKELKKRFGSAYEEYCRHVPRYTPRVTWGSQTAA